MLTRRSADVKVPGSRDPSGKNADRKTQKLPPRVGRKPDGENGFLLEPRNARQITETVEKIAAMTPEERNRLIDAGYELACSMTEDQTTRAYLEANRV